jgi:hypothetical protein
MNCKEAGISSESWPVHEDCDLLVHVYTRPNLRDGGLEYESFMGRNVLDALFNYEEPKVQNNVSKLFLSFPERWLNIIEQRSLYTRLKAYCPNLRELFIKTHSVYIVQCTHRQCIRIIKTGSDKDLCQESVIGTLFAEQVDNLINPSKLNAL